CGGGGNGRGPAHYARPGRLGFFELRPSTGPMGRGPGCPLPSPAPCASPPLQTVDASPPEDFAYNDQPQSRSTYAADPSPTQPSSCAWSLSCWPRWRDTTTNSHLQSGSAAISPQSFSPSPVGNTSSCPSPPHSFPPFTLP